MAERSKFNELRIKTGKQLIQLVHNALDLGIRNARQALGSADSWAFAERCYLRAKKAYGEASRLIPLIAEFTQDERCSVESRLQQLREMLEGLSILGSTPTPTEDEIAALACAFWKARGCPEGLPQEDWFRAERVLNPQRECQAVCVGG
jgi:DUF2934 family protein